MSPFSIRWRGIFRDTAYPEGYSIRGLDVSHHQGKIDWKKVGNAEIGSEPVSFVFMKATEGVAMVDRCYKEKPIIVCCAVLTIIFCPTSRRIVRPITL